MANNEPEASCMDAIMPTCVASILMRFSYLNDKIAFAVCNQYPDFTHILHRRNCGMKDT